MHRQIAYRVCVRCTPRGILFENHCKVDWAAAGEEGEEEGKVFEACVETLAVEGDLTVCCVAYDEGFIFVVVWCALYQHS